jgi:hypothetical protein
MSIPFGFSGSQASASVILLTLIGRGFLNGRKTPIQIKRAALESGPFVSDSWWS